MVQSCLWKERERRDHGEPKGQVETGSVVQQLR